MMFFKNTKNFFHFSPPFMILCCMFLFNANPIYEDRFKICNTSIKVSECSFVDFDIEEIERNTFQDEIGQIDESKHVLGEEESKNGDKKEEIVYPDEYYYNDLLNEYDHETN